jgi:diguanylate cyclase (GGDEF)-like protein
VADLTRTLSELCQAVGAQSAMLLLADADGALRPMATIGRPPGVAGAGGNALTRILRREGDSERQLIVAVPDASGGTVVLERVGREDFSRDEIALARIYARQFATNVVAGAGATGSTWARQLETVQRIGAQLTRLTSIEGVMAALGSVVCDEARRIFDCAEVHVYMSHLPAADPAATLPALDLVAVSGAPPDSQGRALPLPADGVPANAVWRALTSGAPFIVPQVADAGATRPGTWSMLVVPMRADDWVNGVICLLARLPRRFSDDDLRLVQVLSDQAAVAVENARLLRAREELVEELAALLDISQATSGATDEQTLALSLAAKMRTASRMDACIISRWEENSTVLIGLAHDGIEQSNDVTDIADFPATWTALRTAQPRIVHDDSADDAAGEARALAEMGGKTLLMLPLTAAGKAVGLVELISLRSNRNFTFGEMQVFQTMAATAAAGLENARLLEQLRHAADIDQVTGSHNHRYLQERLRQEVARAARNRSQLSVLMLDLDDFKPINDRHGHADGDRVLHDVARTIRSVVRATDIVARYGGDEFVVVMPDTGEEGAHEVARRVIVDVGESQHELSDGSLARVGVSGGLAMFPDNGRTATLLLQAADSAMYSAKRARAGRKEQAFEAAAAGESPPPDGREERQAAARPPVPTMSPGLGPVPAPTAG